MKDLFIEDYEFVSQEDSRSACGECFFEFKDCRRPLLLLDMCTRKENLNKVWKLKQKQENENNN